MDKDDRVAEKSLPITWKEWNPLDVMAIQFSDVAFTESWGDIEAGDSFDCVEVDLIKATVTVYKDGEDEGRASSFRIVPAADDKILLAMELDILRDIEKAARAISGSMKDPSFSALQDALEAMDKFREDYR